MQINLNCIRNNYNKSNQKPAFSSAIPVKVFKIESANKDIDNLYQVTNEAVITKAIKAFTSILAKKDNKMDAKTISIADSFKQNVSDYKYYLETLKSKLIRTFVTYDRGFIFTGKDAEIIENAGKKLGPAKRDGKIYSGTHDTEEVKYLRYNYKNTIFNVINNKYSRIILKKDKNDTGGQMEMHLFVRQLNKKQTANSEPKFIVDSVSYVKEGTPENKRVKTHNELKELDLFDNNKQ